MIAVWKITRHVRYLQHFKEADAWDTKEEEEEEEMRSGLRVGRYLVC